MQSCDSRRQSRRPQPHRSSLAPRPPGTRDTRTRGSFPPAADVFALGLKSVTRSNLWEAILTGLEVAMADDKLIDGIEIQLTPVPCHLPNVLAVSEIHCGRLHAAHVQQC